VAIACGVVWTVPTAATESWNGVTIIEFAGGQDALPGGNRIVIFVSPRGSYASVTQELAGGTRGCIATGVPGSYTGGTIAFGVNAPLDARRHGLYTLCPRFSLTLEGDGVRVEVAPRHSRRHRVLARVPLVSVDFGAPHFRRHEVKGVRLGPVLAHENLGPLRPASHPNAYVHRSFRRSVGVEAGRRRNVQGLAAPAEITGWPWDVLYSANYRREYEATVPLQGLRHALFEQYGPPSAESADGMQWYWFYDLEGQPIEPGGGAGPCADTLRYWLRQDADGRVTSLSAPANKHDFGAWGCSLLMDINARSSSGGATHYTVYMVSGYAMAITHFFQRIQEAAAVKEQLDALHRVKPVLN